MRLVAQTSIISIHGHVGIQDCLREIIDVGEEKKRAMKVVSQKKRTIQVGISKTVKKSY